MDIWDYDRATGVLLGQSTADPDPEREGEWLIPAYATTARPPFVPPGCVAVFDGGLAGQGEWRLELKAVDPRYVALPEYATLARLIGAYIKSPGIDHDTAKQRTLAVAELLNSTIEQQTDLELRADMQALYAPLLAQRS